jgi:uncharacterized protein YqhQ
LSEFNYGGQAVIEGVMMRGSKAVAIAVRAPNNEIVVHTEPLTAGIYTKPWGKWPIVRGLAMLWDTLGLGLRALMFSADVSLGEEDVKLSGPVAIGTILTSLAAGIAIFFLLPSAIVKLFDQFVRSALVSSLIEGLVRILIFIAYIVLIGRWKDIQRVFAYHGAEHKTINAYEAGVPLETDAVERYSTAHTRCGTSFLLIVLVLSILIFARVPLSRMALAPIISRGAAAGHRRPVLRVHSLRRASSAQSHRARSDGARPVATESDYAPARSQYARSGHCCAQGCAGDRRPGTRRSQRLPAAGRCARCRLAGAPSGQFCAGDCPIAPGML